MSLLQMTVDTVSTFAHHLSLPIEVPNPGIGDAPQAVKDKLLTALRLLAYIAIAACVAGVLITAIKMGINIRRGEGSEHMVGLGLVVAACVLVGGASSFVAFFV
jgi:hypothetical protein